MKNFVPPKFEETAFNCPYCGAYSNHLWYTPFIRDTSTISLRNIRIARCVHCNELSVWVHKNMLFPVTGNAPTANADLPEEIKTDYNEARQVLAQSSRSAAALLRVVIKKLCCHLNANDADLNTGITNLVEKGLPERLKIALEMARVIGEQAIPPGQIDPDDDPSTALKLFALVNLMTDAMITQPNQLKDIYDALSNSTSKIAVKK
ncbi:MAG: DUF4145 domain-containing protein [candidate division Zixibacteria bacterium]|nr:DUF4145 domain-containing protein [candidate division Zixibacteria bacterium]